MTKYLVATGIVVIAIEAPTPRAALIDLKERIRERGFTPDRHDELIGMSLVDALRKRQLNFIVMDEKREALLCGELNGFFQATVNRELADALRVLVPDNLYYRTRTTFSADIALD